MTCDCGRPLAEKVSFFYWKDSSFSVQPPAVKKGERVLVSAVSPVSIVTTSDYSTTRGFASWMSNRGSVSNNN